MFTAQGPQVLCFKDSRKVLQAIEVAVVQVHLLLYNITLSRPTMTLVAMTP